jgi:hypothetical protein
MDREAAVLRAEMSRTRAELDEKLTALHAKVSDLTPRRLTERYMPEYFFDRVVGGILTVVGLKLAWSQYRKLKQRHERPPQRELNGYGRWH